MLLHLSICFSVFWSTSSAALILLSLSSSEMDGVHLGYRIIASNRIFCVAAAAAAVECWLLHKVVVGCRPYYCTLVIPYTDRHNFFRLWPGPLSNRCARASPYLENEFLCSLHRLQTDRQTRHQQLLSKCLSFRFFFFFFFISSSFFPSYALVCDNALRHCTQQSLATADK